MHFSRLNLFRLFRNKFSCCFCLIETFLVEEVFNASDLLRDDDVARHVDEGEVAGFVEVGSVDFKQQRGEAFGAARCGNAGNDFLQCRRF